MGSFKISLVIALAAASLNTTGAVAGLHINRGPGVGKGCDQMVTLKHPDLKPGPERRKEWKRCMADPATYNG